MNDIQNSNDPKVPPRDSVENYYKAPVVEGLEVKEAVRENGDRPSATRRVVLGAVLLVFAAIGNLASFSVGLFEIDPEDSIDDSDYYQNDPTTMSPQNTQRVLRLSQPVRMAQFIFSWVFAAISGFGVIAAIGLMRGKRLGRVFSIAWASAALLFLVAEIAVHYTYVFPIFDRVVDQVDELCGAPCIAFLDSICGISTAAGPAGLIIWEVPFFVLPIVVLVMATRKSMKELCQRQ